MQVRVSKIKLFLLFSFMYISCIFYAQVIKSKNEGMNMIYNGDFELGGLTSIGLGVVAVWL